MREIHINISKVIMLSYLYLALPVFIFFFGWLKPGLALFFSVTISSFRFFNPLSSMSAILSADKASCHLAYKQAPAYL
mgnify:CR=1 FL=1